MEKRERFWLTRFLKNHVHRTKGMKTSMNYQISRKHKPISFSYCINYANGAYKQPVDYVGEDAAIIFTTMMLREFHSIRIFVAYVYERDTQQSSANEGI